MTDFTAEKIAKALERIARAVEQLAAAEPVTIDPNQGQNTEARW